MDEVNGHVAPRGLQDGRVEPVSHVLRATFDAENHETLSNDIAGLMIDLSRVPFDEADVVPIRPPPFVAAPVTPSLLDKKRAKGAGWWRRLANRLRSR